MPARITLLTYRKCIEYIRGLCRVREKAVDHRRGNAIYECRQE